jgi:hypothetical protein
MSERKPRTYEVPPGGADAAGLEDYVVETSGGERIGTVVDSVEEGGRRWVVVETGLPPFKRDRRAIPWSEIEEIDHDSLAVRVAAPATGSLERLPDAGREDQAEARRVTESPAGRSYMPTGDLAGPTDRSGPLFAAFAPSPSDSSPCSESLRCSAGGEATRCIWRHSSSRWRFSCFRRSSATGSGATRIRARVVASTGLRSTT